MKCCHWCLPFMNLLNVCWSIKVQKGLSLALDVIDKATGVIGTSKTLHFFWVCLYKIKTYFYYSKSRGLHKHKKGIQKHLKYHPWSFDIRDTWFWLLWKHNSNIYKQDSLIDMYDDMGSILMIPSSHYGTHWSNWSTVKFQDTRRSNRD